MILEMSDKKSDFYKRVMMKMILQKSDFTKEWCWWCQERLVVVSRKTGGGVKKDWW